MEEIYKRESSMKETQKQIKKLNIETQKQIESWIRKRWII